MIQKQSCHSRHFDTVQDIMQCWLLFGTSLLLQRPTMPKVHYFSLWRNLYFTRGSVNICTWSWVHPYAL